MKATCAFALQFWKKAPANLYSLTCSSQDFLKKSEFLKVKASSCKYGVPAEVHCFVSTPTGFGYSVWALSQ